MTGLSDNACPVCSGRSWVVKDFQPTCLDCGFSYPMPSVDGLAGLLTAYRLATAPQDDVWSPIEQERLDDRATGLAREIADLLAGRTIREPVLV